MSPYCFMFITWPFTVRYCTGFTRLYRLSYLLVKEHQDEERLHFTVPAVCVDGTFLVERWQGSSAVHCTIVSASIIPFFHGVTRSSVNVFPTQARRGYVSVISGYRIFQKGISQTDPKKIQQHPRTLYTFIKKSLEN
jgi:hypothetical protein